MDANSGNDEGPCNVNGSVHSEDAQVSVTPNLLSLSSSCTKTTSDLSKINCNSVSDNALTASNIPSDYVFGSNISARVKNAASRGASSNLWSIPDANNSDTPSASVFTTLAKVITASQPKVPEVSGNVEDAAKELLERKNKGSLILTDVDVVTGEEKDTQVVRQHCRAYIFDTDKQKWNNLGAANFHLNDIPLDNEGNDCPRSRIVVRLASTLKLLINTLIWSNMPIAQVDAKSLRISVISEGGKQLKTYLFGFPSEESTSKIHQLLSTRKERAIGPSNLNLEIRSESSHETLSKRLKHESSTRLDDLTDDSSQIPAKVTRTASTLSTSKLITNTHTNIFRPSVLTSVLNCSSDTSDYSFRTTNSSVGTGDNNVESGCVVSVVDEINSTKSSKQDGKSHNLNADTLKILMNMVAAHLNDKCTYTRQSIPKLSGCDNNKECTVFRMPCRLFSLCKKKHEWIDLGEAYILLNKAPVSTTSSTCASAKPSAHSHIMLYENDSQKWLLTLPIWDGLTASLVDNHTILLSTFVAPSSNDIGSDEELPDDGIPEYCAYLLVIPSSDETDKTFNALKSLMPVSGSVASPGRNESVKNVNSGEPLLKPQSCAARQEEATYRE